MSGVVTAVVAVAVSVASTVYSSVAQSEAADEQAALQEKQAQMERESAQAQADIIRDKANRTKAAQAAALAGSGVLLGGGSGDALMSETSTLAEKDALLALKGGNDKAALLEGQASISRDQASNFLVGGALGAASSIAGGVASYQKSQQNAAIVDKLNSQGWVSRTSSSNYSLLGNSYKLT